MTTEEIKIALARDWEYIKKMDANRYKRRPDLYADYMSGALTRGWTFMLSKDPNKRQAQIAYHEKLVAQIKTVALEFIKSA